MKRDLTAKPTLGPTEINVGVTSIAVIKQTPGGQMQVSRSSKKKNEAANLGIRFPL